MIINYRKKRLKLQLLFGVSSVIIGLVALIIGSESIFIYPWLILGLLEIGIWYYENKYQYLKIDNNILTKNSLFSKSIDLTQLTAIKKNKSTFVLESNDHSLKIYKDMIAPDSLNRLTDLLNEIELKPHQV
ncbi:hypothetical protein LB467_12430 [Salegentibacter sp. JZCK2]|uniref:hypothetical protein n=1 Tax=Salegentibacter tibetensis TaxID=2873600 RepID=UPI001CCC1499|nr:hypothetical protein [Salegentibacter tibetensis]MBZ9730492.1 hypothetical protein [Salegentibacter tibetensis]